MERILLKSLRDAAEKAARWTVERDALIRRARAEGATLREVAEAVGLSHTAVSKIESRATPR